MMGKLKNRAKQFAQLEDPAPQDFDPEEDIPDQSDELSGSEESDDGLAGTEHYATVGKSKLRKPEEVILGPEYSGSRVSRQALLEDDSDENVQEELESEDSSSEDFANPNDVDMDMPEEDGDIDSDEALGEGDDEKFKNFTFRGSGKPKERNGATKRPTAADFMSESDNDEEGDGVGLNGVKPGDFESEEHLLDIEEQHSEEDDNDQSSIENEEDVVVSHDDSQPSDQDEQEHSDEDSEDSNDDEDAKNARRAELRKIMGEEQKTVVATISQAAKADAEKGNAVKVQRKAFDSLLSVRMVLQKALIATNSMAAVEDKDANGSSSPPYEAAEEAAIKLWNTLDGLRNELSRASSDSKASKKRKRDVELSTPSSSIWERMQHSEISVIDARQQTLEKWSSKVRGATALPLSRKLNPTAQQSITSVLQDQLASSDHLVRRTKMPRSCAPIQRDLKLVEDPKIYDDGNFYQMLLKELVDQRRVESLTAPAVSEKMMQWAAVKEVKTRKNVDTKASKGRKMRFTVHEKLQNFMAPEDRCTWEQDAIDRFFGTLLGQKMTLGEDIVSGDEEANEIGAEEEGLMLFRSS